MGGGDFNRPSADVRRGAGRGIPDFKENPRAKQAPGGPAPAGDGEAAPAPVKFNAQEASEWMAARYQAVMEEYEKQKAHGKKTDIQNFADLKPEGNAWASSKPVIPPKEDFLFQLQMALAPLRKQAEEKSG